MDDSLLSKIPAELRNNISELALYQPNGVHFDLNTRMEQRSILPPALLALTATCKQMRAETHDMLFAINSFMIHTDYFRDITVDMFMWYDDKLKRAYRADVQDRLLALVCRPCPMLRHIVDLKISLGEMVIEYGEVRLMGKALNLALDRLIDPCRSTRVTCTRPLRVSFVVRMEELEWADDYAIPYSFRYYRDRSTTAADLQQCFNNAMGGWQARQWGRAVHRANDLALIHTAVCAAVFEPPTWSRRHAHGSADGSSVGELRKYEA
ncbi:hypothetical protein LTR56_018245 [Elasticomyces elasticus]|nr:hypothetical protein LTR56_018245 [Elasticomyces elasticus]KAK3658588.1 hypothetical protein LTR22_008941 [Elasticomyces elasticus]KAK4906787.1 hypothetical protein LTR49_024115 [Elasticomyces elasticus]KAK5766962.1 hypothetical protein LTS12_002726 [Elasticomyces elasticus]